MSILGFLFFIFLFIFVFGFSIIASIVKAIFGIGRNKSANGSTKGNQRNEREEFKQNNNSDKRKKLFDHDEGEYVDYEEIKENE